jgi:hypothetical protein
MICIEVRALHVPQGHLVTLGFDRFVAVRIKEENEAQTSRYAYDIQVSK